MKSFEELEPLIQICLDTGCMTSLKQLDPVTYIYMTYKQWYYLGDPIVNDVQYDEYEDMLKDKWPDNPALSVVGLVYPKCRCCGKKG